MNRNYSIADYPFAILSMEKLLALCDIFEVNKIDFGIGVSHQSVHYTMNDITGLPEKKGKELASRLEDSKKEVSDVFMMLPDRCNDPEKNIREKTLDNWKRGLEFTVAAGSKHMTVLPGLCYRENKDDDLMVAAEYLNRIVPLAQDAGIALAVEPHTTSEIDSPDGTLKLLKEVPGLSLTLDFSHIIRDGFSTDDGIPLVAYATHIHCRHAAKGRLQTRSDESEIDYGKVVKALKQREYCGNICLEYCVDAWERQNEVDALSEIIKIKALLEDLYSK